MDLAYSDEQAMLRESAERFVRDVGGSLPKDPNALWLQFAELGWLALPLPEDHGGLGGMPLDVSILLEAFGHGRLVTSYVGTIVLGAGLVAALGTDGQRAAILPDVASGSHRLALAHVEVGPRGGPAGLTTRATADAETWRLTGRKIAVIDGPDADTLIVSAVASDGLGLFLVPRNAAGVAITPYPALGGGSACSASFDDVVLLGEARLGSGDVSAALERTTDVAIAAQCAELVGIMAALLEATTSYTNTREQFGKPLTANQTVRFKLADMAIAVEEARSMALRAALTLDGADLDRVRAVAGAKAKIGRGARLVAETAIQLHGAMGVTEELVIGSYYKRILAIEAMFGGVDDQLIRHARASNHLAPQRVAT